MKRVVAGLITFSILAVAVWFANRQAPHNAAGEEEPAACVERMFAAAARGDVPGYSNCFCGPERQEIERSLGKEANPSVAESLRSTVADLKGWAVVDPPRNPNAGSPCFLVVERVYSGRVDRQRLELRRESSGWKIYAVERSQTQQPAVPYGTPIYGLPLEGELSPSERDR